MVSKGTERPRRWLGMALAMSILASSSVPVINSHMDLLWDAISLGVAASEKKASLVCMLASGLMIMSTHSTTSCLRSESSDMSWDRFSLRSTMRSVTARGLVIEVGVTGRVTWLTLARARRPSFSASSRRVAFWGVIVRMFSMFSRLA